MVILKHENFLYSREFGLEGTFAWEAGTGEPLPQRSHYPTAVSNNFYFVIVKKTIALGVILGIGLKHPKHQTGNETIGQFAAIDPVRIAADG